MKNYCLACGREFPEKLAAGSIEAGGFMLCLGCGHVMVWTKELTLREMNQKEYAEAGTHMALMRERNKIIPSSGVKYKGSWAMACVFVVILAMVVLERAGVVKPIHRADEPIKIFPMNVVPDVPHKFGPGP
jgi:hypothetical protein